MNNVERVQGIYEAFGRGDIPAVLAALAADVSWSEAEGNPYQPTGAPWVGPEQVMERLFVRLGSEWDGFSAKVEQLHDAGQTVVAEGRYTGTFLATGQALDAQMCHAWTFRDGKVTRFQQYLDTAQMCAAMQG